MQDLALPDLVLPDLVLPDLVLIEHREGWRKLVLNRPDRLNAFTAGLHAALFAAIEDADADPSCRALLLTGAGRGFCAGQDISAEARPVGAPTDPPLDLGATLEATYNRLVRRLRALRLPVVCAVNGLAAGAGANVALACDIVLAARSAYFLQAFARIGLVPDAGGTFFLPRLVGEARARGLAMLADRLPAETAAAWGLIWACVDDDALMAQAEAMAADLATRPTVALGLMKRAFAASGANSLDAQLDLERDLQAEAGRSADYAEGRLAFQEKRAARFTGR